jgi:hypothetical protein
MTSWDVVFVTGDRHWSDHVALQEALQHHAPGTWLVEGGAPGADHVAKVVGMALYGIATARRRGRFATSRCCTSYSYCGRRDTR